MQRTSTKKLSKSETGEYKCTCESTFAFASYLKRRSKTREKEQLACEKCGKMIQRRIILKNMF